jgi:hypothetical protein
MTGMTKSWNDTNALTGFPGSITTGVCEGPTTPKPCGLPGVDGHRAEAGCAQALQGCLDAVALAAHADPAAGDDQISIGGGLVNRSEYLASSRPKFPLLSVWSTRRWFRDQVNCAPREQTV